MTQPIPPTGPFPYEPPQPPPAPRPWQRKPLVLAVAGVTAVVIIVILLLVTGVFGGAPQRRRDHILRGGHAATPSPARRAR